MNRIACLALSAAWLIAYVFTMDDTFLIIGNVFTAASFACKD